MKQIATIILIICMQSIANGQKVWHAIEEVLTPPESPSGFYNNSYYFDRYDTVRVIYRTTDSTDKIGYKVVFVYHGFYMDNKATYRNLLNSKKKRVYNVTKYHFIR